MGAVMGYSEQHSLLLLSSDEDIRTFTNVSKRAGRAARVFSLLVGSGRAGRGGAAVHVCVC